MDIINAFPGYEFVDGKNIYRGTDVGKGGYVYAEPGMYGNIAKAGRKDKKTRYYYYCKNTVNATGHKCTFRCNIEQSQIDDVLAKLITAMTREGKFKDAIQDRIGATVDTSDLEKQLSVLNANLHQAEIIKTRLEQQMDNLDVTEVIVPVLCEGRGTVRCQHGILPIPVPAVANIVAAHGLDLQITETEGELVTPTGAAIAAAIRTEEKLPKHFKIIKTGLGAGKRAYDRPSILRVMILETTEGEKAESGTDAVAAPAEKEGTVKLETNIDDCSGEELGYVMDQLFDAGAKDVHYTPVFMKKNRPAYQLNVICKKDDVEKMEEIIFYETSTIGIRRFDLKRCELPREMKEVETELGKAMVKICSYKGMKKAYPEYDCVRQLAREHHKTFDQTFRIVKAAAEQLL